MKLIQGNLFDSTAEALAHGCNCQGIMGAGIAAEFKRRYPIMYEFYKLDCQDGVFKPGDFSRYWDPEKYIYNLATQDKPGANARYSYVRAALTCAMADMRAHGIKSFAMPKIGCGIGGLDWNLVEEIVNEVEDVYSEVEVEVWYL